MFIIFFVVAFTLLVYGCGEAITEAKKKRLDAEWEAAEDDYLARTLKLEPQYDQLGVPAPHDDYY